MKLAAFFLCAILSGTNMGIAIGGRSVAMWGLSSGTWRITAGIVSVVLALQASGLFAGRRRNGDWS